MFNLDGEVIGVNTSIYSPPGGAGGSVGIGFAVPSSIAKNVVAQIRELGRTRRGWLGVQIQGVGETSRSRCVSRSRPGPSWRWSFRTVRPTRPGSSRVTSS